MSYELWLHLTVCKKIIYLKFASIVKFQFVMESERTIRSAPAPSYKNMVAIITKIVDNLRYRYEGGQWAHI